MSIKNKGICYHCIGEDYLKKHVRTTGKTRRCSYCNRKEIGISINNLADKVAKAFEQFYERTSLEPSSWEYHLMNDKESDFYWERHGDNVFDAIMEAAELEVQIANDIQEILEERFSDRESAEIGIETEFSSDSYYERKVLDDRYWQQEWEEFEKKLKNEARHFNQFGINLLDKIFDGIDMLTTDDGNSLLKIIGPGTSIPTLFRARVFHSDTKLKEALMFPDQQLGPPPSSYALPGRMNARGISMFYGAINEETAISEVRPPVGSKVVLSKFKVLKELKLLNLSALKNVSSVGSIFDPNHIHQVERDIFLRKLSTRMSSPVMPDDEPMDYLITQAIADYLAMESKVTFDGIMYPSVQSDKVGINIVLFHKSSRVKPYSWKLDVELGSYTDEGWEWDYRVTQKSRKKKIIERKYYDDMFDKDIIIAKNKDLRDFILSIEIQDIKIHHITAVRFDTNPHDLFLYK